ncbi:hypothetical protein D9757_004410 [Collybiopsis confluens]|uniref:Gag protein n=1 Tax=Collybiopsis confluens TaxID=2823264 RepID=A0A8H5HWL2_9AGAR|nr:hypothetical protein D9757_004410 [Collybiopsis confluens]
MSTNIVYVLRLCTYIRSQNCENDSLTDTHLNFAMSSNPNSLPNLITFPEDKQLVGLNNWAVFRDHVKSVARSAGLNGYLDGTISAPIPVATAPNVAPVVTPVNSRTPTPEEWELRDARLAGIVFQNIKDPRSIGVTQDMTLNVMWIALTDEYENSSAAAQTLATERIQQCKYTTGTAFEDYFKSLEALRKSANDVGCNISNDDLRSRFLTSLPRDYLWILQNHGARPFPELKKHLIEYDMMVVATRIGTTGTRKHKRKHEHKHKHKAQSTDQVAGKLQRRRSPNLSAAYKDDEG